MNKKPDIEIEYKFKVDDKAKLITLLDGQSNKKTPRQYQSNVMFDNPSSLMQITDGRIRIRTLGESGEKTFTYKRPLPSENGAKREIEYEIQFTDSYEQIEKILGAMEFAPTTSYERYQTRWELDGVDVTLDEYPYADIIEIEGPKEKIMGVASELGFNVKDGLTKPADTLFQEWRQKNGLPFKPHMRFKDYNK